MKNQTAPKFMTSVKARFVGPPKQNSIGKNEAAAVVDQAQHMTRPHRAPSGNFSSKLHQLQAQQQHHANSGSLSHRTAQQTELIDYVVENAGEATQTPTQHKIALQKFVHHSANLHRRELSGMKVIGGNEGSGKLLTDTASPQGSEPHVTTHQQQVYQQQQQLEQNLYPSSAQRFYNPQRQHQSQQQQHQNEVHQFRDNHAANSQQRLQELQELEGVESAGMIIDSSGQKQFAMSEHQMQMFSHLTTNVPTYTSALQTKVPGLPQQVFTQPPVSPTQTGSAFGMHGELNAATMASQFAAGHQQEQHRNHQQKQQEHETMLMGYNTNGSNVHQSSATSGIVTQLAQSMQDQSAQSMPAATYESLMEGVQIQGGGRIPNYVLNKQQQQQIMQQAWRSNQPNAATSAIQPNSASSRLVAKRHSSRGVIRQQSLHENQNIAAQQLEVAQKDHSLPQSTTNKRASDGAFNDFSTSLQHHQSSSLHRPSSSTQQNNQSQTTSQPHGQQQTANRNLMKQLYSAKGGVQTPPANFRGGSQSSVGSRRQSGESSGMISMGSIGTNCNEGGIGEMVQKPLVREFKTQDRLNKVIMPANSINAPEEPPVYKQRKQVETQQQQHGLRKVNGLGASLAKKNNPKPNSISNLLHQQSARTRQQNTKRASNNMPSSISTREQQASLLANATPIERHQQTRLTGLPTGTKKLKSVSESHAFGQGAKGSSKLKSMMKQQVQPDIQPASPAQHQHQPQLPDRPDRIILNQRQFVEHTPEQPGELDNNIPKDAQKLNNSQELNNSRSKQDQQQVVENSSTNDRNSNKNSFQHQSSIGGNNQEAVERNEELMSLLACLNEQAIKELGAQQETEWDTGMQRLLKAYKIMVETKNPNSFDANYKAIICYNLACCCQMQGELHDCSKYLSRAIDFVSSKLLMLKEQAVSHFNQSMSSYNKNQMGNATLEQHSMTTTTPSITVDGQQQLIKKKNINQQDKLRSGHAADQTNSVKSKGWQNSVGGNQSATPNNRSAQAHSSGSKARFTGGLAVSGKNGNAGQSSRIQGQRTTIQKNLKSPLRPGESGRGGRTNAAAARPLLGATQTTNSLFSDFSRLATANQKGKVSQQQLRTISVNGNNLAKGRGIGGAHSTKNAQSQAQFSKAATNLLHTASGSTPQTRSNKGGGAQAISDVKRREGRNTYGNQPISGQPQTVYVNQDNFFSQGRNIRDNKKASQKAQPVLVEDWLECYSGSRETSRPPREILERSIHLTRYYCRFVLQLCAVLSQLNEHEQALSFSKKASRLATELTEMTQILIKEAVKPSQKQQKASVQDTSGICDNSSQKPRRRKHSTSNQLDPYNTSLSKQKTTVSARFNNQGGKGSGSQNSSLVQSNLNQPSKDKVSQSYTMSNFNQLGAGRDQQSSGALNNSGFALSYLPNPEQIKNERDSLQRIHTFSLKEPTDLDASDENLGSQTLTGNFLDPLLGSQTDRAARNDGRENRTNLSMEENFSGTRQRGISAGSRNSSTTSNRSCSQYVPEKVKIFQKQIDRTYIIVHELISIQKEFRQISELNFRERRDFFQDRMAEKKRLKISFQTYEEMNKLQIEQKYKITARSTLGVKNYSQDDWIFSFNIGNIMHLQTLGFDELANAKTSQSMMKGADAKQNSALLKAGIQGSVTTQQAIRNYLMSEISKDQLLYKSLYVIVSQFCIGTELRFLATLNPQKYNLKDSEIWHAKAIHIASYFMPNDCPLIQHIAQSYAKHHLRPKIKRRQDQLASLAANCGQ